MAEFPLDLSTHSRGDGEEGADFLSREKLGSTAGVVNARSLSLFETITSSSRNIPHKTHDFQRGKSEQCTCTACEQTFPSLRKLDRHSSTIHIREKLFGCVQCGNKYSTKQSLKQHISRVHERERPQKCPHCEAAFFQNSELITHLRVHTGEKPFGCDLCHSAFGTKGNLARHKMRDTGEKPYKCQECDRSCISKQDLTGHSIDIHGHESPHECSYCGRGFARKIR